MAPPCLASRSFRGARSQGSRRAAAFLLPLAAAALLAGIAAQGCVSESPSPFLRDENPPGPDAGVPTEGGGGGAGDAALPDGDPTLGGPCLDDSHCDDGVDCTFDSCDLTFELCRFTPNDGACQNAVYCDGVERCDPKLGCRYGEPVGCDDNDVCTLDACLEASMTCGHTARDADLDGDPDNHCGGGDCDDADPSVSSLAVEVCLNFKDDDCDKEIDEAECANAQHDTCDNPLGITQAGSHAMTTVAAKGDYAASCGVLNPALSRDVVAEVLLPAGPPRDVEVTARTASADVAVAAFTTCGDATTEIACGKAYFSPQGGRFAKLRARGVGDPSSDVALAIHVFTDMDTPLTLDVAFLPATTKPTNETCGTAMPLVPGVPTVASIVDPAKDLVSNCGVLPGELVYSLDLDAKYDVWVYATSLDGDGLPSVSLRDPDCAMLADEIQCKTSASVQLYKHGLGPGTHYVSVSATSPSEISVVAELSPPIPPAADENCNGSPPLTPNETISVDMALHEDDLSLGCYPGAVDAAYELILTEPSDVLLVERIASGDVGAVELAKPPCAGPADMLACGASSPSPVRAAKHNVPPGSYRAVVESAQGQDVELTAFVRPAVPPTLVAIADTCADAVEIPLAGGFFQGNTANATADYDAGCDFGGVPPLGAPDQMLKLVLPAPRRVILDMRGSSFATILDVRLGPSCPGTEFNQSCAVGVYSQRSYLDLTLPSGTYWIQIDGFNLDKGQWFLDAHIVDP